MMASGRQAPTILLCGWYGTETLGDKAILGGVVQAIREAVPDSAIDVASLEPYVTAYTAKQMPELSLRNILSLVQAKAAISNGAYDCVAIAGGPLMSSVRECIDLLELFAEAKKADTATVVAGCGIGPLSVPHVNQAIAGILRLADRIVLRDTASARSARDELGYVGQCQVALDPAFLWISTSRRSLEPRDRLVIALREWNTREYAPTLDQREADRMKHRFEDEVRRTIDELQKQSPGTELVPFCMHKLAVGGDDRAFYRKVARGSGPLVTQLDNRHRLPKDDLAIIEGSRAVLAMRFHSVVFALATYTPFLAIDYTNGGKTKGLLEDIFGKELHARLIPIDRFSGAEAARQLVQLDAPDWDLESRIRDSRNTLVDTFRNVL